MDYVAPMLLPWLGDQWRKVRREIDDLDEQKTGKAGCLFDGCCSAGCLLDAFTVLGLIAGTAAAVVRWATDAQ